MKACAVTVISHAFTASILGKDGCYLNLACIKLRPGQHYSTTFSQQCHSTCAVEYTYSLLWRFVCLYCILLYLQCWYVYLDVNRRAHCAHNKVVWNYHEIIILSKQFIYILLSDWHLNLNKHRIACHEISLHTCATDMAGTAVQYKQTNLHNRPYVYPTAQALWHRCEQIVKLLWFCFENSLE